MEIKSVIRKIPSMLLFGLMVISFSSSANSVEFPARFQLMRSSTIVESDGKSVQTIHYEVAVSTNAAARQQAQQSFNFNADVEQVSLLSAMTIKADGTHLAVPETSVRIQGASGTQGLSEFSNRKQMIAIFPDVAGGDVLSMTWQKSVINPVFAGQFTHSSWFIRTLPWDEAEVIISLPAGMHFQTEEFGPTHTVVEEAGRVVHRWRYAAPGIASDPAVLLPIDRVPRLFASTFTDWPALSRAYTALITPKIGV